MKFLPKCLSHLDKQTYPDYEIIFVDAGSTDGSAEFVKENFPEVKLFQSGRIGIGEAVNLGIKVSTGDILIFDVNTDEYVEQNWLEELIGQLQRSDFNIITGGVRIIHNTNLIDEAGVRLNFFGRSRKVGHGCSIDDFTFNTDPVDFVGAPAFHRKIMKEIGFIDEAYFIYAEDLDFCYRARLAGYPTHIAPLARSHHHIRGTIGKNNRRLEYYLRRANIRFQLIYSAPTRLITALLYFCNWLPALALMMMAVPGQQSKKYKEKFIGRTKAILWNLNNLRSILRSRDWVKKRESCQY